MSWDRKQRQEAILREKIAVIVIERLSDPRLGFVTITGVELSKDKKIAKVFYTVLGTDAQIRSTSRALSDSRGRIQEQLAPTLRMRSMPELRFIYNEQVAKESRLLDLIQDVTTERVERAGPDGDLQALKGEVSEDGLPEWDMEGTLEFPSEADDGLADDEPQTAHDGPADSEAPADDEAPEDDAVRKDETPPP